VRVACVQRFVIEENIHRFEVRLRSEADPHMREVLGRLLHEERVKLEALLGLVRSPPASQAGETPSPSADQG
jgi:hypothetical protein